jgi:hypothetical protein
MPLYRDPDHPLAGKRIRSRVTGKTGIGICGFSDLGANKHWLGVWWSGVEEHPPEWVDADSVKLDTGDEQQGTFATIEKEHQGD